MHMFPVSRRPPALPPPPQWVHPGAGAGLVGRFAPGVRTTLRARLRLWLCVALQCDLLISQHATSCSAVSSDSARCHDAVCGFAAPQPSANQVRCNAPVANARTLLLTIDPKACGKHGHTVLPSEDPSPHPSHRGWGGLRPHCAAILPEKVGTMDPPLPIPQGGGGFVRSSMVIGGWAGGGAKEALNTHMYIYIYICMYVRRAER